MRTKPRSRDFSSTNSSMPQEVLSPRWFLPGAADVELPCPCRINCGKPPGQPGQSSIWWRSVWGSQICQNQLATPSIDVLLLPIGWLIQGQAPKWTRRQTSLMPTDLPDSKALSSGLSRTSWGREVTLLAQLQKNMSCRLVTASGMTSSFCPKPCSWGEVSLAKRARRAPVVTGSIRLDDYVMASNHDCSQLIDQWDNPRWLAPPVRSNTHISPMWTPQICQRHGPKAPKSFRGLGAWGLEGCYRMCAATRPLWVQELRHGLNGWTMPHLGDLNIALEDGVWYSCKPNDDKPLSLVYDIIWYSMYIYILYVILLLPASLLLLYIYTRYLKYPAWQVTGWLKYGLWFWLTRPVIPMFMLVGWCSIMHPLVQQLQIYIYIYSNHPKIHMWHGQKMEV